MGFGGFYFHCFPHRNFSPIDQLKDEFARNKSPIESSHFGSIFSAPSYNAILGPVLVLILVLALIPTPAPALISSDELFSQFIKAYLESNPEPNRPSTELKQSFKPKVPDMNCKIVNLVR